MLDTIKSYLVSLGFNVDQKSYNEATKSMDNAGKNVAQFAGSAVKNFAIAGAAVTSFVAASVFGIAKFIDGLGKASIENEKLARQMWTSEQNAMAFNSTLKAMGVSLQDLYLSPTLMSQFQQLRKEAIGLQTPADYKNQMHLIQSVSFEFKRMKLEATYALQWIGYYFIKYMSGPITQIKKTLSEINAIIIKTMPTWTKVVAQVMSWFVQMGITTVRAIKDIIRVFDDIGQVIPKNLKLIASAASAVGLIIATGPIGIIAAILIGIILLLNDFYTYLDGGESAFGPFWKKIVDFYNLLKADGTIDSLIGNFKKGFAFISGLIDEAKKRLNNFYNDLEKNGTLDNLKSSFENTFGVVNDLLSRAIDWVNQLFDDLNRTGALSDLYNSVMDLISAVSELIDSLSSLLKKFFELDGVKKTLDVIGEVLKDVIVEAVRSLARDLQVVADTISSISDLLKGDFSPVLDIGKNLSSGWSWGDLTDKVLNYAFPQATAKTDNSKTTLTQTNNIYGADPRMVADQAQNNMISLYNRNFKGVIR